MRNMLMKYAVITHQQNHARLQSLRATADSLDETIKTTIRLLADTRKEIQSIPSLESDNLREVGVDELLQYAKFIAPTTVPPTFQKPIPNDDQLPTKKPPAASSEPGFELGANGIATPAQQQEDIITNPGYTKSGGEAGTAAAAAGESTTTTAAAAAPPPPPPIVYDFVPWPDVAKINSGALGAIQRLLEEGRDPGEILSKEEQAEVERRRREEEAREKKEAEERERENAIAFGGGYAMAGRRKTEVVFNPDDL